MLLNSTLKKMANKETICKLIKNQKLVTFTYNGFRRVAELYMQGTSTADNTVVKARQVDGEASDPILPAWKTFETAKIRNLRSRVESFESNKEYTGKDEAFKKISCKL